MWNPLNYLSKFWILKNSKLLTFLNHIIYFFKILCNRFGNRGRNLNIAHVTNGPVLAPCNMRWPRIIAEQFSPPSKRSCDFSARVLRFNQLDRVITGELINKLTEVCRVSLTNPNWFTSNGTELSRENSLSFCWENWHFVFYFWCLWSYENFYITI